MISEQKFSNIFVYIFIILYTKFPLILDYANRLLIFEQLAPESYHSTHNFSFILFRNLHFFHFSVFTFQETVGSHLKLCFWFRRPKLHLMRRANPLKLTEHRRLN